MKKTILALALAAGLTSFAGNAKAGLSFNWSFTGDPVVVGNQDTVEGTLTLNDAGTAATSLKVTKKNGLDVSSYFPFDLVTADPSWYRYWNSFAVVDGKITAAAFSADYYPNPDTVDGLLIFHQNDNGNGINFRNFEDNVFIYTANYGGFAAITFTPVSGTAAVPEPSQVAASILLIGGIAGFVIVRRRKTLVA